MGKQAELMYGDYDQVNYHLDNTECTEAELRAALLNAFRRIQFLDAAVARLIAAPAMRLTTEETQELQIYGGVHS